MKKSKISYAFTWIAFINLLVCNILLLVLSWNSLTGHAPSPTLPFLFWILISASAIYLFLLAVKKAHRLYIDEKRSSIEELESGRKRPDKPEISKNPATLDFAATARKLVRRVPENISINDLGKEVLKNLSKELEIMSGIFYVEKEGVFEAASTFAMSSGTEPYSFKSGEGLTGQAVRNQQLMVLTRLPKDYLRVYSGLGKAEPSYLAIVPLTWHNRTIAVLECSGYKYEPDEIEKMFRIFSRDLMDKLSPGLT